jgi:tyrosyl-tRNA synthetase
MATQKINTDEKEIDEFLTRGVDEVITEKELKKKMMSGKQLRAYIGYDVTGPDLHLGHGATLMKLKHWQRLGHQVVLVIGDDTSRIGDHSDKLEKRKRLTNKEIDFNKQQFKEQFAKIVDIDKAEVRYNSEWLDNLKFRDVVELASLFSVQQMIERENFSKRLKNKTTIGLEEILYPLMQGFDSVALKVDLEMGATDQRFNLLAGRKIMEAHGMKPQNVITVPFVTGTDGRKMGKSLGNYVPMRAEPRDLYGGIMSSTDDVIIEYFERLTEIPMDEIHTMEKELKSGKTHPMEMKKKLAYEVTQLYYDEQIAQEAQKHFERAFQDKSLSEKDYILENPNGVIKLVGSLEDGEISALDLAKWFVKLKHIPSNADAKRMIEQRAIEVNGKKLSEFNQKVDTKSGTKIKVGKKKWIKLK